MNARPSDAPSLDLDDYAFDLPEDRIAQRPLAQRDASRLLVMDRQSGALEGLSPALHVRDLPRWLRAGDLLVRNATAVLPARLRGQRSSGGAVEALLLGAVATPQDDDGRTYRALVKISGRLRIGLQFRFVGPGAPPLTADVIDVDRDGEVVLRFEPGGSPYALGEAPLPPYIRRPDPATRAALRDEDSARYQTVYARVPGAVAAPTAGLHLTDALLEELVAAGVRHAEVVLHVGAGTFRPLRPEDLAAGRLHREAFVLPEATARAIAETRAAGGRVVAIGTTTVRVLESCATGDGGVASRSGETDLLLVPGATFSVVDGLLTNFHLPRSSLLLLVAAFAGRAPLLDAYRQAIEAEFRFYSYGDAMLIV